MDDEAKTKAELLAELQAARQRLLEYEQKQAQQRNFGKL
jgi:hypothetical protein